jgi:hypothetical protein
MRTFSLILLTFVIITPTIFFISCTEGSAHQPVIGTNQMTESRTSACPKPEFDLQTIPGSPCASLKLEYSGTNDPESDCTFISIDIKTFKTWDPNEVKTFESTVVFGMGNYVTKSQWYSTLNGRLLPYLGNDLGISTTITNVTGSNANTQFEFFIPANPDNGPYNWVCVKVIFECNNTECTEYKKCFDTYTPCI